MRSLQTLRSLRLEFSPVAARRRRAALRALALEVRDAHSSKQLLDAHEAALFAAAFPDDESVLRAARRVLQQCAERVDRASVQFRGRLLDSGVAGSETVSSYSLDATGWLLSRFPRDVELDRRSAPPDETALEALLHLLAGRAEADSLYDTSRSSLEWLDLAGGSPRRALNWLVDRLAKLPVPPAARDRLWEPLNVHVRWQLRAAIASRTFCRFPPRPTHFQRGPLQRGADVGAILATPLPPARPLPPRAAGPLIDMARAALACRGRETDPVTYANPREVTLLRLERGLDVALFGMLPERRLPVESYFGYVAAKNGVPIGYGGGWVFFRRCAIGVNVFDTFRGGESAWLFAQLLRVYHQHYRVTRFEVDPYQFGADNEEAIRSGAFWFYYRLGFRPTLPVLANLAEREAGRIAEDRSYRTSPRTLRRLATGPVALDVAGIAADPLRRRQTRPSPPPPAAPDLTKLSVAATRWIGRRFGGDLEGARSFARRCAGGARSVSRRGLTPEASRTVDDLAVLIAMHDGRPRRRSEWRAVLRALAAKPGNCERDFALQLQRCRRLAAAWTRAAEP